MRLLDCTLRDGGYYSNWDFNNDLVEEYCTTMNSLPIDYIEVGYRSPSLDGYLGEFYYCPTKTIKKIKKLMPKKKLVIMLNSKDIKKNDLKVLLEDISDLIKMVRLAISPDNLNHGIDLAKNLKKMGFEVGLNIMYMSKWASLNNFYDSLKGIENNIDYLYLVDSFGGIYPGELTKIINDVKKVTDVKLGFHGHNNLELALINSITALKNNCSIIDSTITGMGRGAGNLKTELFLTHLKNNNEIEFDLNNLSKTVEKFEELRREYNWGTNLAYMISGKYSIPQKNVMNWITLNRYSINTIIKKLSSEIEKTNDIVLKKYPFNNNFEKILIVGGGSSVNTHSNAINDFIKKYKVDSIIFSSSKHVKTLNTLNIKSKIVILGNEASKISFKNHTNLEYIFPPSPREMGTYIGNLPEDKCFEISFSKFYVQDPSPLSLCCDIANAHKTKTLYLIGFDGFDNLNQTLFNETSKTIEHISKQENINFISLTQTKYKTLKVKSIYSLL